MMRRIAKGMWVAGVVVLVVAAAWVPLVTPMLKKFPNDLNVTVHFTGTFSTHMDAATGMPLATPAVETMTVDRALKALPKQSGAHTTLVQETITLKTPTRTIEQKNVYAIDRRSMKGVKSAQAYSLAPQNVVDRTGAYTLTLPMGFNTGTSFPIWKTESSSTYPLTATSPLRSTIDGLKVVNLTGILNETQVAPLELQALVAQGMPTTMSSKVAEATVGVFGGDVSGTMAALLPSLTDTERQTVQEALITDLPLKYFTYSSGDASAEQKTGQIVKLSGITDGITVQPDVSSLAPVLDVLKNHVDVTGVPSLITAMTTLAQMKPQVVYEMKYDQTPASISSMAKDAKSMARQIDLVDRDVPLGLMSLSALLLIGALLVSRRRPPAPEVAAEQTPAEPMRHAA